LNQAPRKRGSLLTLFLLLLTSHFEELDEGPDIGHKWHLEPDEERIAGIFRQGLMAKSISELVGLSSWFRLNSQAVIRAWLFSGSSLS
jgi:hypothetical protein